MAKLSLPDKELGSDSGEHLGEGSVLPNRRVTIFALVLAALWTLVGGFVYLTNQPENVLTTSWQNSVKTTVQTVLPEQWGFFTRSPREDELLPYQYRSGRWASASAYPHSQAQYAFGWNRISRAQGIEIGVLYKELADQSWQQCSPGYLVTDCLVGLTAKAEWIRVSNPSPDPTLCGRVAISKALPPPWAWANIGQAKQDVSVIFVDVAC
ncbi:SdpA family antimicrobial peptide system protein [Leifsonia sp. NPDC102414]|uniref:SdpA family antimicrobial peptide system protein n=1 Tax=Leifsonia sp. NPDC102414 TaxID=3364124 RepID=UPI00380E6DAF